MCKSNILCENTCPMKKIITNEENTDDVLLFLKDMHWRFDSADNLYCKNII